MNTQSPAGQARLTRELTLLDKAHSYAVASFCLSAAWELGLLDEVQTQSLSGVSLRDFAQLRDYHYLSLNAMVRALALIDVVVFDGARVYPGKLLEDAMRKKGFFYWLTRGCGELFSRMPELARNENRSGAFISRDLRAVGIAARDAGNSFIDREFYDLVVRLGVGCVADLGCGSAERLIRLAENDESFMGIGIDISVQALDLARDAISEAGVGKQVSVFEGDVKSLTHRPEYDRVTLVSTFMMGHDLWPRDACIDSIAKLGAAFPNATHLVLCDTYRYEGDFYAPELPAFTLAFETAHAVMNQRIPSLREWTEVFEDSGWQMIDLIDFALPPFTALMQLKRK